MKWFLYKIGLLLSLSFLGCASTSTNETKGEQPKKIIVSSKDKLILKMPTKSWSLQLSARDFQYYRLYERMVNKKEGFVNIEAAIDPELSISIKFGNTARTISMDDLKRKRLEDIGSHSELVKERLEWRPVLNMRNFKGEIYTAKLSVPWAYGVEVNQMRHYILMYYDEADIEICISKANYKEGDEQKFARLIESIEITEE
jgi:hypothetical protein